jgi:hypothetical protein
MIEAEISDGDVKLIVYRRGEGRTYWLQAGAGALEFPPAQYRRLRKVLLRHEMERLKFWRKTRP